MSSPRADEPTAVVLMGVSGCGKSTVGPLLAQRLGWAFADGDAFHPPANIDKMRRGVALGDEDRRPWLEAIAAHLDSVRAGGGRVVVACSALKRAYRDILIGDRPGVRLAYLQGDRATVAARLAARDAHFMPPALLDSQFAALEEPQADERAIVVSIERPPAQIAEAIRARLA